MRLIQRLFLQSVVVTAVFGVSVLGAVEWRVRHRLETFDATLPAPSGSAARDADEGKIDDALLGAIRHDMLIATGAACGSAFATPAVVSRRSTSLAFSSASTVRTLAVHARPAELGWGCLS